MNRRKGVIVGNDQEGDDSVITAHVSTSFVNPLHPHPQPKKKRERIVEINKIAAGWF